MLCRICNEIFNERRRLIDLFRTKEFYVCGKCLKKYPFEIEYNLIPLDSHMLEIISLFKKDKMINYDAFVLEYSEIYKKILEINENKFIIFVNKVFISEELLNDYSHLSTLLDTDIVLLTNLLII